ncbi:MAG: hypothetical protein ACR2QM_13245 [Longimicrobiales bacterium]
MQNESTPRAVSLAAAGVFLASCGAATVVEAPRAPQPPASLEPAATSVSQADPVRLLQAELDAGTTVLAFDSLLGYLPALLAELQIPASSQTLVFSRTSLQTDRIGPWAPRALYFNDDVYVGWVQDSPFMELASMDPRSGAKFYTMTQRPEDPLRFRRETTTCLLCHDSRATEQVPGLIMRSTLADRLGYPVTGFHSGSSSDATPMESRWGGWYVTGSHGSMTHAGNLRAEELFEDIPSPDRYITELDRASSSNQSDLSDHFDVTQYLTPHSDITALMVLTHQVRLHNLMSVVQSQKGRFLGTMASQNGGLEFSLESSGGSATGALDRLLRTMMFVDEAPLTDRVQGNSEFATEFPALGPFDGQGRSLRDFDLETRLFRYPVSFLIYSESFDALPGVARNYIYDGIAELLTVETLPDSYSRLEEVDRAAVFEVLRETKPEFAERVTR